MIHLSIPRIPIGPNGPNGLLRMHWTKRRKERDVWRHEIQYALASLLGPGSKTQTAKVKVLIHQVRSRLLDRDNLYSSVKFLVDAIVWNKLAWDDAEHWMELCVTQAVGKPLRTEITITEDL